MTDDAAISVAAQNFEYKMTGPDVHISLLRCSGWLSCTNNRVLPHSIDISANRQLPNNQQTTSLQVPLPMALTIERHRYALQQAPRLQQQRGVYE